jgi:lambda repressor-like predicted transcriptional regulator
LAVATLRLRAPHSTRRRAPRQEQAIHHEPGPEGGDHPWRQDRHALGGYAVSVVVHPGRLRQELARRGWAARDLAREARLSEATVSTALAGKPIAARSLALITEALVRAPILPAVDGLLMTDSQLDFG